MKILMPVDEKHFFFPFIFLVFITSAQTKIPILRSRLRCPMDGAFPPAGNGYLLGDLPLNIAVSNSKKLMAVTNNGQSTQSIQLIDVPSGKILDNIVVARMLAGPKV